MTSTLETTARGRTATGQADKLLRVEGLKTHFHTNAGIVQAVDGVTFEMDRGTCLGIVGESACGKSVTALTIMRLIPSPPARIAAGKIWFNGVDLLTKSEEEMRSIRGNDISMIFQEPMTSLNPAYTVGNQIAETILYHEKVSRQEVRNRSIEMLRLVGIPDPEGRIEDYPHQLSGGMRQRVMIAMALSCNPRLLIADEPTTALDVTIQAQILDLMRRLREEVDAGVIMITHDLGVIAELADQVVVMYAGNVVEKADVRAIFANPQHPYTEGLLISIPKLDETRKRLPTIEGTVPNPLRMPPGCRFHPRCPHAREICRQINPPQFDVGPGHVAACWKHSNFEPVEQR